VAHIRVAAAQLNTVVGDLSGNVGRCLDALRSAEAAGADVCVMPELAVTGYPPEDLLLKPGFVADNVAAMEAVAAATGDCAAAVGFVAPVEMVAPDRPDGPSGPGPARWSGALANAAAVCADGRCVGIVHKRLLPNYGVFDEDRWFIAGRGPLELFLIAGARAGVTVCEDVWSAFGPVAELGRLGADVVLNLNASPYSRHRRDERLSMLGERVSQTGCAIVYANQVGGQDELVYDGASLVLDRAGTLLGAGRQFVEDLVVVDVPFDSDAGQAGPRETGEREVAPIAISTATRAEGGPANPVLPEPLDPLAEVYEALVLGTRDYLVKNGFTDAVIGLSGGIDSSLVATVAVDALGPEHVHGFSMPSRYSSEGSMIDAGVLAERLGIDLEVVPIEPVHAAMAKLLAGAMGTEPSGLTDENLQSRLRGVILMALSNATGSIVLTTGNKSEMATGYSTLYGDSAGGFAVIKDVPKTLVYELCHHRNARDEALGGPGPIPETIFDKPPSAELRPDQRDDQSLPPYDLLDPVLEAYVEGDRTAADLVADGFDPAVVERVVRLVDGAEYKRRQMPPGVRISRKAFGKDRRMPITNHYVAGRAAPAEPVGTGPAEAARSE
jgi:NAD+ synthase (glutamine-hydrolysing)